ncbi:hypothetical protein ACFVH6_00095 [Spirillospora sp. NPDC127200]
MRLVRALRAHWLMAGAVTVALVLRALAVLGYPTILWFGDSVGYLRSAVRLAPSGTRPSGYSVLLAVLKPFHSFIVVVTVQHLLGLAVALMVYALVWRHVRAAWPRRTLLPGLLGALVAAPVLFDAYQIELEHLGLSDALFTFLLVAAVVVLLWRPEVGPRAAAASGGLLGLAAVTRSVGWPLLLLVLAWLFLRRRGKRALVVPAAVLTGAYLVPLVLYAGWFYAAHERVALTNTEKVFLYGRTMDFADCEVIEPRPELAKMCPKPPPKDVSPAYAALWTKQSPFAEMRGGKAAGNDLAGEFAFAALKAQPGDYLKVVGRDVVRAFAWERTVYPSPWTFQKYEFPDRTVKLNKDQARVARAYTGSAGPRKVVEPYAGWMRGYQDHVFLPGTVLGAVLLVGAAGLLWPGRGARHRALLPWLVAWALLVVPAATADFDYRYVLPAMPFAALAAVLAFVPHRREREAVLSGAAAAPGTGAPAAARPALPERARRAWRATGPRSPAGRWRRRSRRGGGSESPAARARRAVRARRAAPPRR